MRNALTRKKRILTILFICGMAGWVFAGMPWGIFTANFVYLVGASQGISAIVIFLWLLGVRWMDSYLVPAGVVTLSFAPIGFLMFLGLLNGQEEIFYWTQTSGHALWFTPVFFFARNLGGLVLFYSLLFYTLSQYLKDRRKRPVLLCALLILFVLNQTIIAWDFGMNLSPGWHSTIFAPYFWFGDLYIGLAFLMGMVEFSRNKVLNLPTWTNMRKLLLAFSIIWAYLWWSQFITIWYANIPEETGPLYNRYTGRFALTSMLMFLCLFLVPFGTILFDKMKRRSLRPIVLIILAGFWIERYLLVIPPILQFQEAAGQAPKSFTSLSALTTIGIMSGFLLFLSMSYTFALKIVPTEYMNAASPPE